MKSGEGLLDTLSLFLFPIKQQCKMCQGAILFLVSGCPFYMKVIADSSHGIHIAIRLQIETGECEPFSVIKAFPCGLKPIAKLLSTSKSFLQHIQCIKVLDNAAFFSMRIGLPLRHA